MTSQANIHVISTCILACDVYIPLQKMCPHDICSLTNQSCQRALHCTVDECSFHQLKLRLEPSVALSWLRQTDNETNIHPHHQLIPFTEWRHYQTKVNITKRKCDVTVCPAGGWEDTWAVSTGGNCSTDTSVITLFWFHVCFLRIHASIRGTDADLLRRQVNYRLRPVSKPRPKWSANIADVKRTSIGLI